MGWLMRAVRWLAVSPGTRGRGMAGNGAAHLVAMMVMMVMMVMLMMAMMVMMVMLMMDAILMMIAAQLMVK